MTTPALVRAEAISQGYVRRTPQGRRQTVLALDRVSFEVMAGETWALVGVSGSGKSTLGRCLALLEPPSSGEIRVDGRPTVALAERHKRPLRRQLQLIDQDPAEALNPRFRTLEAVVEPLRIGRWGDGEQRRARGLELLAEVALDRELERRRTAELSGGQKQRVVIARSLAAAPRMMIFDESLASLDLPLRSQMIALLGELRRRHGLTYLFITHDLDLAARLADRVAVLDAGRLVEHGRPAELFAAPCHPATRALVEAARRGTESIAPRV